MLAGNAKRKFRLWWAIWIRSRNVTYVTLRRRFNHSNHSLCENRLIFARACDLSYSEVEVGFLLDDNLLAISLTENSSPYCSLPIHFDDGCEVEVGGFGPYSLFSTSPA